MIVQDTEEIVKYTDIRSPFAWRVFWGKSRSLLPLLVFSIVCSVELAGFSAWRLGRSLADLFPPLIAVTSVSCFLMAMLACGTFRRRPSMQQVELDSGGIKTLGQNPKVVPWERVGRLALNQLPGAAGVSVFSIGYAPAPRTSFFSKPLPGLDRTPLNKRRSRDLTWMRLALLNPAQTRPLRNGVDALRAGNPSIPELREFRNRGAAALWLMVLAMFLFVHGLPLLGVGLERHHQQSNVVEEVAPGHEDKMATVVGPMLARHFHNERQRRLFFSVTGASLTLAGIGVYTASFSLMRRKPEALEQSDSAIRQSVSS
jgi:hypothetical protein